uniref:Thymidine kinase n=1 Tax=Human herpesvirus 2 TaxID=10310 RepID=O55261_HHV2|nr:thymidine kinase [Human alphaherpesvirus 2]
MASHAGQQHAPAFGQAARASGPTDGRAASRPSHRQGASEARGDPELPTLLRVYIDGPHGVGKTTTSAQLMEALGPRDNIVYVPEPMTYWQVLGASETLTNIYNTQHRLDRGEISAGEAAVVMTSAQITMSTPYAATDAVLAPHIGGEAVGPQAPPPALTLVFDRHPIASLLCYPAARYLMGSMTPPGRVGVRGPHAPDRARHEPGPGCPSGGRTRRPPGQTPTPGRAA